MVRGADDQSIKAYSNAYKLGEIPTALFGRTKCYVATCLISKALADISTIAKDDPKKFKVDLETLTVLNTLCIYNIIV